MIDDAGLFWTSGHVRMRHRKLSRSLVPPRLFLGSSLLFERPALQYSCNMLAIVPIHHRKPSTRHR